MTTGGLLLFDVARASEEVGGTRSRSAKIERLAALLRTAAVEEVPAVVAWLSGELLQRRVGVGWASVASLRPAASEPALRVADVNRAFAEMAEASGPGSQGRRNALLAKTFGSATTVEQAFLRSL